MSRLPALGALAGAGIVLSAGAATWATGSIAAPGLPAEVVQVTGSGAMGLQPLALVLAAGGVALGLAVSGKVGRLLTGAVLLLAGAGAAVVIITHRQALDLLGDTDQGRVSGRVITEVDSTLWPWVAVLGAVVGALSGVLALWQALAGARLVTGDSVGSRAQALAAQASAVPVSDGASGQATADPDAALDPQDAWDALSRGEDPTVS